MIPQHTKDLVFIHNNLHLLSSRTLGYLKGETKMQGITSEKFDSFEYVGVLEVANLSSDELELEKIIFTNDIDESPDTGDNDVENEPSDC